MTDRLEGQPNFRDLGGIAASGGATVRMGRVLRSGDFASVTDADLAHLERRVRAGGLVVYDLRSGREVGESPDRLPPGCAREHLPIDEADGIRDLIVGRVAAGDLSPPPGDLMVESYRRIVERWTETLAALMRRMVDDPRPSVIHCTQGKDRTGVAVALILSAVGVGWADVEDDYLRSNERRADHNEATMAMIEQTLAAGGAPRADVSWIRSLLYVDARYLRAARAAWERRCGSTTRYLAAGLGLSERDRAVLRARLLDVS